MNWDAIGAVGEILGAVAVVATLGYLARQLRQQNAATEAGMINAIMESFNSPSSLTAADPALARIWRAGLAEPQSLTDDEASQFSSLLRMWMNNYYKMWRLAEGGVVPRSEWAALARQAAQMLNTPGGKLFEDGHPVFGEFFEAIRKEKAVCNTYDFSLGRGEKS